MRARARANTHSHSSSVGSLAPGPGAAGARDTLSRAGALSGVDVVARSGAARSAALDEGLLVAVAGPHPAGATAVVVIAPFEEAGGPAGVRAMALRCASM